MQQPNGVGPRALSNAHRQNVTNPARWLGKCFVLAAVGVSLSSTQLAVADDGSSDDSFNGLSFVVTNKLIPLNNAIYLGNTTAPEWVYFSGNLRWLSAVRVPAATCTPTNPCQTPALMVVSASSVKGVGLTSGSNYTLSGFGAFSRSVPVPGATVLKPNFVVIPPRNIKPVGSFIEKVTVPTVMSLDSNAKLLEVAAPPSTLVSWWQAEGTGADAMGINPGTVSTNETVTFVPGKVGQAFHFQGQGFVEVQDSLTLQSPTVTLAAWVHASAPPGTFTYIASKGAADCSAPTYGLYTGASGGLQLIVSDGSNFFVSPAASTAVWDGNWHFAAGVYDGSSVRLYVDGVEVGTGTPAALTLNYAMPTNNKFYIGAFRGSCEVRFTGDLDEVQVYPRALLPAEILGLYNASH